MLLVGVEKQGRQRASAGHRTLTPRGAVESAGKRSHRERGQGATRRASKRKQRRKRKSPSKQTSQTQTDKTAAEWLKQRGHCLSASGSGVRRPPVLTAGQAGLAGSEFITDQHRELLGKRVRCVRFETGLQFIHQL